MSTFYLWNAENLLGRYVGHLLNLAHWRAGPLNQAKLIVVINPQQVDAQQWEFLKSQAHPRSKFILIGPKEAAKDLDFPCLSPPFTPQIFFSFVEDSLRRLFSLNDLERSQPFIGEDEKISRLRERIPTLGELPDSLLLEGEPGTGKELYARHLSVYWENFIKVAVAALPQEMIEPVLFGFYPGVIKRVRKPKEGILSKAQDGLLYLENLEFLPLSAQQKLLFFLETGSFYPLGSHKPVSVRVKLVVSITKSPGALIREGKLLDSLYFRLARFSLHFPPLRKRLIDLPLLAFHFVMVQSTYLHVDRFDLSEDLFRLLLSYRWPRNVAELEEVMKEWVIYGEDKIRERFKLPKSIKIKLKEVEEILGQLFQRPATQPAESNRKDQADPHTGSR